MEEKGMFDGGRTICLFGGKLGSEAGKVDWRHMVKGLEFWVQTFRSSCVGSLLHSAPLT